uniref:Uncharacterized protein n=1 Tax=Candidatus Kentrum sp. TUN TaxID=2126343 RepID=A0A451AF22_9GAMM|nr:MAG: hypothetical protein BECKTUN1418F_GA0071002_11468 [Candidatus Kentron sp. TUN]VFK64611.1 MAG: hypothetical protein BECKTUN1418D_GA0071000_12751 [Candidatus Kentron sp. TUN]VFK67390.1 MAG: hypothetical protein BECKTUN1418E_GA0071001_11448 [Candidatus Kentron sp. TUN]
MGPHRIVTSVFVIVSVLATFAVGVAIFSWWLGWIPNECISVESPSSPVSVANTYIVFTTFIFVTATVVLVVISLVFYQQFSDIKSAETKLIFEKVSLSLKTELSKNDSFAKELVESIFSNEEFRRSAKDELRELAEAKSTKDEDIDDDPISKDLSNLFDK